MFVFVLYSIVFVYVVVNFFVFMFVGELSMNFVVVVFTTNAFR